MLRLIVAVVGGVLLLNFLYPSNPYGNPMQGTAAASASHAAPKINTVDHTEIQLGASKAKFELDEVHQDGHIDGYRARVINGNGKVVVNLPVTKSEGKKLLAWAKEHHVFQTAGSFAARAATYLAEI